MITADSRLESVGKEAVREVVAVLCAAFVDYPVMRFVLRDAGPDYERRLESLVGYFTDQRFARGYPVLGVRSSARLVAAANVNPPGTVPAPPELIERYRRLKTELGEGAIARFDAFAAACAPFEPAEPHYYLGMIGVLPECRGHGHARRLLEALHALSARDESSTGVALTTESPDNLPLYERFGYGILGSAKVEELTTWTLFRPDA